MRIYTVLTDAQIERMLRSTPASREQLTTVYSDEGIYEIRHKIHKVCIQDAPCETLMLRGRDFRTDPSVRVLQERWQIPLPHDADTVTALTYDVAPGVRLVFEQNFRTRYYFVADTCGVVGEWLETLPL